MEKRKLAIIGLGSAGIQSLCHMLSHLDNTWEIFSIYDPNIKPLGIGESTNPTFTTALQYGLDFDFFHDMNDLNATIKIGTVYKDWREKDFINPLINGVAAIHFDTHALKDFAIPRLKQRWKNKLTVLETTITSVENFFSHVEITTSNDVIKFDYVIDCRGFPKNYEDYVLCKSFVTDALVYNSSITRDWNYTGHRATLDGWMFEVPLKNRTSYGYLYNSEITEKKTAVENFKNTIKENISDKDLTTFQFTSYYAQKMFEGRICKNGNRAVFFEPMFANSLWLYNNINFYFVEYINNRLTKNQINECFRIDATKVKDMIAFNYHGGSCHNSNFWNSTKHHATEILHNSIYFNDTKAAFKMYNYNKEYWVDRQYPYWVFQPINLLTLDRNFEYNYFS